MRWDILIGVGAYLSLMLWVGQKTGAKIANTKDYVMAGRRLPLWLNMTSLFATWFGAETCMGAAGEAMGGGLLAVIQDPFGAALCLFLLALFVAPAMYGMNVLTLSDYLQKRYGRGFGPLSAVFFIAAYMSWLGSQLVAFGVILSTLTGFPPLAGTLLGSTIILIYTYKGGLLADAWNDFIQAIVLIPGMLILFFFAIQKAGGWDSFFALVPAEHWRMIPKEGGLGNWMLYLQAWCIIGLGSLPSQDLYQRASAGRSLKTVRLAAVGAGFLYLTIGLIPVFIGIVGPQLYPLVGGESEHVLVSGAMHILPPFLLIIFMGSLLAAIMSTADSVILAPATLFTENILKPFVLNDTSDANILLWCRRSTIGVTAIALLLALSFKKIYALTMNSSAILMASLLVPFLAGIWWPRANRTGALAAIIVGSLTFVGGKLFAPEQAVTLISALLAGVAMLAGSFLKKTSKRVFS